MVAYYALAKPSDGSDCLEVHEVARGAAGV